MEDMCIWGMGVKARKYQGLIIAFAVKLTEEPSLSITNSSWKQ